MALVESERRGSVLTITLADVDRRNALSSQLTGELMAACDAADRDPTVRVIVVTNRGSTFCAGANLSERSGNDAVNPATPIDPSELFGRFARSPKPYVGRIDGHCIAGGMGLAAGLDITVARKSARFGFTEVRIGVAPAMISVVCLPKMRTVDAQAAMLRGNRFDAAEAARMGLITAAVDDDDLDATIDSIVEDLLLGSPVAIAAVKRIIDQVPSMPTTEAYTWTAALSRDLFAGEQAREGMSAFLEKRRPSWAPPE